MKQISKSLSSGLIAVTAILLLAFNLVLDIVLTQRSRAEMQNSLRERMLEISNTAAAMLDGDVLTAVSAKDQNTDPYRRIEGTLAYFLNNEDVKYIYCLRSAGNGKFIFTIDPALRDAAEFGRETVTTTALIRAGRGVSAVDEESYEDAWGEFYSAYAPVFNSQGKVAGVVAADFSADWYEDQLSSQTVPILIVGAVSLIAGAGIVFLLTRGLHNNFKLLFSELTALSEDVEALTDEIASSITTDSEEKRKIDRLISEEGKKYAQELSSNEIDKLSSKVRMMRSKLRTYIGFAHQMAYLDSMTGAKNKTAYLETVKEIKAKIQDHTAAFSVAVFDINGLKATNDNYGHEYGDRLIKDSCSVMKKIFGKDCVYRIGGDEFIAVMEDTDLETVRKCFRQVDDALKAFNSGERGYEMELAFSKGGATFDPKSDTCYLDVFKRADQEMYADKAAYYINRGDRRKQ